jgi:hypothetical protein
VPASNELLAVFGVVVFAVHSWSVGGFLYHLPYFVLKKPFGDIAGLFSYYMVFALLESLLLTAALVACAAVLPGRWLREGFAYKGTLVTAAAAGMSIALQESPAYETFTFELPNDPTLLIRLAAILALFVAVQLLGLRVPQVRKWTMFLVEQVSIMLFIYIPLDVLGLVVTAMRLV